MAVAKVAKRAPRELVFARATATDSPEIAALRNDVAERLTVDFGAGHWSSHCTAEVVEVGIVQSHVLVARAGRAIIATLRLLTKKPWAIDPKYFTSAKRPIYLVDMAVRVDSQRHGVGRQLIEEAKRVVAAWPGDAIRLDAYDATAGAGDFYAKCGFRERGSVTYRATPLIYYECRIDSSRF